MTATEQNMGMNTLPHMDVIRVNQMLGWFNLGREHQLYTHTACLCLLRASQTGRCCNFMTQSSPFVRDRLSRTMILFTAECQISDSGLWSTAMMLVGRCSYGIQTTSVEGVISDKLLQRDEKRSSCLSAAAVVSAYGSPFLVLVGVVPSNHRSL